MSEVVDVYQELVLRGIIAQCTNTDLLIDLFKKGRTKFYIGFDATADSLHVGHLLQCVVASRLQQMGCVPIILLGTGTTLVGDPTGRSDMRPMLSESEIKKNADVFRAQISRFIDFSNGAAYFVENGDWLKKLNYIEMLRDVGCHFSVNRMLAAECFKTRMEHGLSFLEFNYMIMQSYDFLKLYRDFDCRLQVGGDDQWSNIIGGVELVRRVENEKVCGLTCNLLTTKDGKKMGKTQAGALWLDKNKCSVHDFYQYWRNIGDEEVIKCLKFLTFLPLSEINEMAQLKGEELNDAKTRLAYEITKLVHGEQEAKTAQSMAQGLFGLDAQSVGDVKMPTTMIRTADLLDGKIGVLVLLVKGGLCSSNSEARRLILQGGIEVNGERLSSCDDSFSVADLESGVVVKKGKKSFMKFLLQD